MDETQDTTEEIWKPIPDVTTRRGHTYSASSLGRIRNDRTGRILRPTRTKKGIGGYVQVSLRLGKDHRGIVSRLVLSAFVGPPPLGTEACHRNNDPTDNHLGNLRWDTKTGNETDKPPEARRKAVDAARAVTQGSGCHLSRLTEEQAMVVLERLRQGESPQQLADQFGVSLSAIKHLKRGRSWKHLARLPIVGRPPGYRGHSRQFGTHHRLSSSGDRE